MMGAIIEGTHMKFGKFRPWIVIGAVLTGTIIIVMFNVQNLEGWSFVVFMAVMYLLWESAFTMNDIGYWSMLASLSSKRNNAIPQQCLRLCLQVWAHSLHRAEYLFSIPATCDRLSAGYPSAWQ